MNRRLLARVLGLPYHPPEIEQAAASLSRSQRFVYRLREDLARQTANARAEEKKSGRP